MGSHQLLAVIMSTAHSSSKSLGQWGALKDGMAARPVPCSGVQEVEDMTSTAFVVLLPEPFPKQC